METQIKIKGALVCVVLVFLFVGFASASTSVQIADHGTDARNSTNDLIEEGNLTIFIYDNETGGNEIFSENYTDGIINGSWNVIITAEMEYGKEYWKDYSINGEDLNYSGEDRLEFHSPLGYINNASFFNFSLIGVCSSEQSIRQVYENGTVICEDDTDTHVTGSGYLYNDSSHIYINGTTLNNSIDVRLLIDDTRVAADGVYLYNDSTIMYFNETLLNITIDARDAEDNASWNESFADTKYINKNEEGNLDVNSSTWWAAVSNWVSGWFYKSGNNLAFNETKLNMTIDNRVALDDTDTDTHVAGDGVYLTNNSDTMSFDETKLNATIDDRVSLGDTDTHVAGDGFYLTNDSNTMSFNEALLNATIDNRDDDTNTHVAGDGFYLTNNSNTMFFDETKLNATIDERDNDTNTHVAGDGIYLTNNSNTMFFDETKLNATIDERDNDTTYTGEMGIDVTGTVISANLGTDINTTEIETGTIVDADINDSTNLTLGQMILFSFHEPAFAGTIDNIVNGWIRIVGSLNVTGDIETSGNVTASYFLGDGSLLTNVVGGIWTDSSGNATYTDGKVGIGTTSPVDELDVDGSIRASESYVFSDGSTQVMASVSEGFSWHVGSAVYHQVHENITASDQNFQDLVFKPDGKKMYVVASMDDMIIELDLSDPWNITSETYIQNLSVTGEHSSPDGIFFKPDGTKMYFVGNNPDELHEYNLSDPWNVTSALPSQMKNLGAVAAQGSDTIPEDVFFKFDGTKMYIADTFYHEVTEYDLSTPWDISSASRINRFDVDTEETSIKGVFFRSDGMMMYIVGTQSDEINQYKLSTPWDTSSAVFDYMIDTTAVIGDPYSVFFKPDGTKMYIVDGSQAEDLFEYDMGLIIGGRVGIGTTSPSYDLDVAGNVDVSGNYRSSSNQGWSGTCTNASYIGGIAVGCND